MSASVYPASLEQKGRGFRFQAYCFRCQDGENTKTRRAAQKWCTDHNTAVDHNAPTEVPGALYTVRPGRTYAPRQATPGKDHS